MAEQSGRYPPQSLSAVDRMTRCSVALCDTPGRCDARSSSTPFNCFRQFWRDTVWRRRLYFAARAVARLGPRDHVTPTLKDRHWLPIEQRIVFKLCLLMQQVHTGQAPSYPRSCVTASADMTSRPRLRSASNQRYERQRTRLKFAERPLRSFSTKSLEQSAVITARTDRHWHF